MGSRDLLTRGGSQRPTPPDERKLDEPSGDKRARKASHGNDDLLCIGWTFRNDSNKFRSTDVAVDGGIRRVLELRSATGETELCVDVGKGTRIGKDGRPTGMAGNCCKVSTRGR